MTALDQAVNEVIDEFKLKVRRFISENGVKQCWIAASAGIHAQKLSELLNTDKCMSINNLVKLSTAIEIPIFGEIKVLDHDHRLCDFRSRLKDHLEYCRFNEIRQHEIIDQCEIDISSLRRVKRESSKIHTKTILKICLALGIPLH